MKKLVISVLIVAAVLSCSVFAYTGKGTQAEPYLIATKEDLQTVAAASATNSMKNKYFKQTADIAFGTTAFSGIGNGDRPFMGFYDGNGYAITGSNFTGNGIFNAVSDAMISNLTSGITVSARDFVGGIAGKVLGQTVIENCTFNGVINVPANNMMLSCRVGGIAGFVDSDASVEKCETTAGITVDSVPFITYVGGIVGQNHGAVTSCKNNVLIAVCSDTYLVSAGGIAGYNSGAINYCFNEGDISGETENELAAVYAGGIAGYNEGGILTAVQNNASVLVTNYGKYPGYAGGIAGYNAGGIITVARNDGNVITEGAYSGGIVGLNFSMEDQIAVVDNTVNRADVTGEAGIAGGIAGVNMSVVDSTAQSLVSGSVNLNAVNGGNAVIGEEVTTNGASSTVENVYALSGSDDNATFMTESQFKSATSLAGLDAYEWAFPNALAPNIVIAADDDEAEIIYIDNDTNNFAFSVYNPGASKGAVAMVSYYNAGRLIGISISNMTLKNGYTTCSVASAYASADNVNVMVLDSLTGLIPLIQPLRK